MRNTWGMAARYVKRLLLVALMALASVNLFTGAPLFAIWVGSRVQATLWSGARQFETTKGFVSDERRILQILTGYLGGGTAFPNRSANGA